MARRTVLLPAPDGPTRASNSPGAQVNSTLIGIESVWCRVTLSSPCVAGSGMALSDPAGQGVGDADRRNREGEEHRCHDAGARLIESLGSVVDRERDRLRLTRDAAAHHQHHSELTHGMSEGECE